MASTLHAVWERAAASVVVGVVDESTPDIRALHPGETDLVGGPRIRVAVEDDEVGERAVAVEGHREPSANGTRRLSSMYAVPALSSAATPGRTSLSIAAV